MKRDTLRNLKRFSFIPLVVIAILVAVFAILDIRISLFPPLLFPVLQTLFVFLVNALVAYWAAASFRRTGSWEMLLFGTTLLIFGTALMLAAWFSRWGGLNANTTIHNTSALLGSILLLISVLLSNRNTPPARKKSRMPLAVVLYGGAIVFMGVLAVLTLKHLTPTFFVEGGPTLLRQTVQGTATLLLIVSTVWMVFAYYRSRADFLYWCGLGFGLIIIGFAGGLFVSVLSDPVSWLCRISFYLSSAYLLTAGLVMRMEAQEKGIGVEELAGLFMSRSRQNYEILVETASDAIISMDEQCRILMWNRSAERMFGYSRSKAIGSLLFDLIIREREAETLRKEVQRLRNEEGDKPGAQTIVINARKNNGEEFPVEARLWSARVSVGWPATGGRRNTIITLVAGNITERQRIEEELRKSRDELEVRVRERTAELTAEIEHRKRAEEELRESQRDLRHLSSQLLIAQETERREIAGDLHDNIWQILNTIRWKIEALHSPQVKRHSSVSVRLESIISDIRHAIEKIRTMQGDLWPPLLDDIGILATIDWYCREFGKNHEGISIEKEIFVTEEDVPEPIKSVIYRVMQEGIDNIVRHSGASRVLLFLKKDGQRIEFKISDNGGGFDIERILFRTKPWIGFGLMGMKERVERSNGMFEIDSTSGRGTTIRVSWPLTGGDQASPEQLPLHRPSEEPQDSFRMVTEAISDWVYAFRIKANGDLILDWVTPGFTEATGYRPEDFPEGYAPISILHPDDHPIARERLRHIKALKPWVDEYRIVKKDGEVCWVRDSINPVADPLHPGTIQVVGATQNITEHKRSEERLRESKEELKHLIQHAPAGIYEINFLTAKFKTVNDVMCEYLGYAREELLSMNAFDVLDDQGQILFREKVRKQLAGEKIDSSAEYKLRAKDGREFFAALNITATYQDGKPEGAVVIAHDITERKRAEEALKRTQAELEVRVQERTAALERIAKELKVERQRFNVVLETLPAYLILLTPDHHVAFANRFFRERFGESQGRRCFDYLFGRSEPCESCETYNVLKTMGTHEWEWTGPDRRDYHVFDFPFTDADGSTLILEMGIDITERKQTEVALRESENRLRDLSNQLMIAHEQERKRIAGELHDSIASSLAAIKFNIEKIAGQIEEGTAGPGSLRDIIPKVGGTIDEVRRIVTDLRPSILDDLGIIPAIRWFCREFEKTYSHIGVKKQISVSENQIPVSVKTPIYRICQEAMNNIAKHGKANLVNLCIQKADGRIELTVKDNGQGFEVDKVTKGLGLSTMRERAEFSGGSFGIESRKGEGTVIRASWPI